MHVTDTTKLLCVERLSTHFHTDVGVVRAVDGVSFDIDRRKVLGLVGESGCGKSVTARSIMRLIHPPGRIASGRILCDAGDGDEPVDLATLQPAGKRMRRIRGKVISMIFQEPMTCLSPVHTIGNQIVESIREHDRTATRKQARQKAIDLLAEVGMPNPQRRIDAYTFELSGGMRQRAMIAVALAAGPQLLIADEPTTAVDVTTQAKILALLKSLQASHGMAMLFVTHDLGVVAQMADEVAVMYLGKIVEQAPVKAIFDQPKHPYTQALLRCLPGVRQPPKTRLVTIDGRVPTPHEQVRGCPFSNRCEQFKAGVCDLAIPALAQVDANHRAACFLHSDERE